MESKKNASKPTIGTTRKQVIPNEDIKTEYTITQLFKKASTSFNNIIIFSGMCGINKTQSSYKAFDQNSEAFKMYFCRDSKPEKGKSENILKRKGMRPDIVISKKTKENTEFVIVDVKNHRKSKLDYGSFDRMTDYTKFYGAKAHIFLCSLISDWEPCLIHKLLECSFFTFNLNFDLNNKSKKVKIEEFSDPINPEYFIGEISTIDNIEFCGKLIQIFLFTNLGKDIILNDETENKIKNSFKERYFSLKEMINKNEKNKTKKPILNNKKTIKNEKIILKK